MTIIFGKYHKNVLLFLRGSSYIDGDRKERLDRANA